MRAIILAAGRARRFGDALDGRPKCLLELGGTSLLARQTESLRRAGVTDIVIVRGYAGESLKVPGARYYTNPLYDKTNMVYSLFCASNELTGDVLVTYADIIVEDRVIRAALTAPPCAVGVVVDSDWYTYYSARYAEPTKAAESLVLDHDMRIVEIGAQEPAIDRIQGQYIGVTRFSADGCDSLRKIYGKWSSVAPKAPVMRGRNAANVYMTDVLQGLIDGRVDVRAIAVRGGWLEFDSQEDYAAALAWEEAGTLSKYCRLTEE